MRIALALLVALTVPGCVLVFDDDPDDPGKPPVATEPDAPVEVAPLLCTSGAPGSPTCPINVVPIEALEATGSFSFAAQPVNTGLYLSQLEFRAGPSGLSIEEPALRFRSRSTGAIVEHSLGASLNLPPNTSERLEVAKVVMLDTTSVLSLQARAISPYHL